MCIRDRLETTTFELGDLLRRLQQSYITLAAAHGLQLQVEICLLYTSDAADERSSVDLGGRRIIKKNTRRTVIQWCAVHAKRSSVT